MDIKKILLISLIAVAIVASVSAVSAGLFDGLLGGNKAPDNVIELDNIQFNMSNETNVTKFKLNNTYNIEGGYSKYYLDEDVGDYNVWIYNDSGLDNSLWVSDENYFKNDYYNNVPAETVNGVVVYTTSAAHGKGVGNPMYESYVTNEDLKTMVRFATPNPNETAKMVLSLDFK